EDGIRDLIVTGVQTCALPIYRSSKDRLAGLEKQLAELSEKRTALRSRWNQEKEAITRIRGLKAKLEEVRTDAERAERAADFAKRSEERRVGKGGKYMWKS